MCIRKKEADEYMCDEYSPSEYREEDPAPIHIKKKRKIFSKPTKCRNSLIIHDNIYMHSTQGKVGADMFHAIWTRRRKDGLWHPVMWVGPSSNIKPESRKRVKPYVVKSLMDDQCGKCRICRDRVFTGEYSNADVDHIIPLIHGGTNHKSNLQIICVPCHRKKSSLESRRVVSVMSDPGVSWDRSTVYVTNTHVHYDMGDLDITDPKSALTEFQTFWCVCFKKIANEM